jgi:DNA gyrase subunit A
MMISNSGKIIRLSVNEIPLLHRSTQGVKLIELDREEKFVGLARVERAEEEAGKEINDRGNEDGEVEEQNDVPNGESGGGNSPGTQD